MIETTLCYIENNDKYLMLLRCKKDKAKDPSSGKWIGVGGKFLPGENAESCMLREVEEETGLVLKPDQWHYHGLVEFISDRWESEDMHLFSAHISGTEEGQVHIPWDYNEEGELRWIPREEIMDLNLWEGDKIFLKKIIDNQEIINLRFVYEGDNLVEAVEIPDYGSHWKNRCKACWNNVAKPLNSLGKLESLTARIANVQGTDKPHLNKRRALVFCGDNGVVEEGVSQSGHEVTSAVAKSMAEGLSNVNLMADCAGAEVRVFDVGMIDDVNHQNLINAKIRRGTRNFTREPAMTRSEAVKALQVGIQAVHEAKSEGCDILITGEMGIGNTTSSSAVISALTGTDPELVTGRGSGLNDDGLERKINAIKRCLEINRPDPDDGIDVLAKAGGFDIAAMAGVYIGAAHEGIPVILDGFISAAAALLAVKIEPGSAQIMIPSHISREPGVKAAFRALAELSGDEELESCIPIDAGMALGEGTGGMALLPLLDMALAVYYGKHKFSDIGIDAYV